MERPPKPQGDEGALPGQQGLELLHPRLPLVVLCRPLDGVSSATWNRLLSAVKRLSVNHRGRAPGVWLAMAMSYLPSAMPANRVAESTVSMVTVMPASASSCCIRAARPERLAVQARV